MTRGARRHAVNPYVVKTYSKVEKSWKISKNSIDIWGKKDDTIYIKSEGH